MDDKRRTIRDERMVDRISGPSVVGTHVLVIGDLP